jgi:hypothetical protein
MNRYISDGTWRELLLHQFAHQLGESAATALHNTCMVTRTENAVEHKKIGLRAFPDIEGVFGWAAFGSVAPDGMRLNTIYIGSSVTRLETE